MPKSYRLPKHILPTRYDLHIQPMFTAKKEPIFYNGRIKMYLNCVVTTSKLMFNMKDIELTSYLVNEDGGDEMRVNFNYTYEEDTQFFVADNLKAKDGSAFFKAGKKYVFSATFKVNVRNDNVGFYKSSYVDADGTTKWLLTSQMEPVDARKAFPCFDEPDFKAEFQITVLHDYTLKALTNMPMESQVGL